MRLLLLSLAVLAAPAFADIPPQDVQGCHGKALGAGCSTDDGQAGTCTETMVSRLDYSGGSPPRTKQVKMTVCVQTAAGSARSALPWLGAGLGFLALVAALGLRPSGGRKLEA